MLAIADSLPGAPQWPREAYLRALDAAAPVRAHRAGCGGSASGQIVGFAVAGLNPPEAELETIAVAASVQRRGVGAALLHDAIG